MPTPMMPPTPMAVSCQSPSDLNSPLCLFSSSMSSSGLRRMIDWVISLVLIRNSCLGCGPIAVPWRGSVTGVTHPISMQAQLH